MQLFFFVHVGVIGACQARHLKMEMERLDKSSTKDTVYLSQITDMLPMFGIKVVQDHIDVRIYDSRSNAMLDAALERTTHIDKLHRLHDSFAHAGQIRII
jgi:hypothetical protein